MNLIEYMTEHGLKLERKGLDWWCSCPFHKDDTPSLQVSERDGKHVWYCFSCKRGGGPSKLMAELEGVPEWDAKRKWAELAGERAPEEGRVALTKAVERLAANGHPYLRARGITDDTCRKFGIGYCDDYGAFLGAAGLDEGRAADLGLFDFSKSIVYPFFDHDGCYKVAARTVEGKSYRTSPDKSKYFRYGLWGMHLLRGPEAWIFEGFHDAMAASQAGYQALAAAGTDMPAKAWEELRDRGIERAVFVPDGDEGGRGWLERLADSAPADCVVEVVALERGDPDDALAAGMDFRSRVQTPFEWLAKIRMNSAEDLAGRVRAVQSLSKAFLRMPRSQREMSKEWFSASFGGGDELDWLHVDIEPDLESERTVLANCLYSKGVRLEATQKLEEWHFNTKAHKNAFALIRDREATPQMLQVELKLDLSQFVDLVNFGYYIDRVKETGTKARVSRILSRASPADVGRTVEELYRAVDRTSVTDGADLISRTMERINERVNHPGMPGIQLRGFPTLNKVLMGMVPGRLIYVSGNSGHGKTTLACNVVDQIVDEYPGLFVSLEMTEDEIADKQLAVRSGVPSMKMVTGSMEQPEYDRVLQAAQELRRGNLQVVYGVTDLYKIVALIKAHAMRRKIRWAVIDYVQLITLGSDLARWEQLALITKTLKVQLGPLGITTLALTQLTKQALKSDRTDGNEQAGAYAMVADADAVLAVRKEDPTETKDGSNFSISVTKNRFGFDEAFIPCAFDRATQKICELI